MLAFLYRIRGMGDAFATWLDRGIILPLCGLPFGLLAGFGVYGSVGLIPGSITYALISMVVVTLITAMAMSKGHGPYMDLGKMPEGVENGERKAWLDWLFNTKTAKGEFWALCTTGWVCFLALALILALSGHYFAALVNLVASFPLKGIAYKYAQDHSVDINMLEVEGNPTKGPDVPGGEFLFGLTMDCMVIITAILLILGVP